MGGSTRIPKVQQLLQEFFDGKELSQRINPDEVFAYGAALQGNIIFGSDQACVGIIMDLVPLSLGIKSTSGIFTKMVPRNSIIPIKKSQTFSTTVDDQSSILIRILQGEHLFTENNRLLSEFELSGILPAPRGVPQIEVTFEVDANGTTRVWAADVGT